MKTLRPLIRPIVAVALALAALVGCEGDMIRDAGGGQDDGGSPGQPQDDGSIDGRTPTDGDPTDGSADGGDDSVDAGDGSTDAGDGSPPMGHRPPIETSEVRICA